MMREIVSIDESLCDGCGLCIPSCHEGALQIVDGKAKLVSERACDGLGACLGHCPKGALQVIRRAAESFSEQAVAAHHARADELAASAAPPAAPPPGGCPGSRAIRFDAAARSAPVDAGDPGQPSALTHWPVQLRLISPQAPVLRGARLLIAADCVPFAYADFHAALLHGRTVVVGCPKLDDLSGYVAKLTEIFRAGELRDVVVARMEVPCCMGIVAAAQEARRRAGVELEITEVVLSIRGERIAQRALPAEAAAQARSCNVL